MVAERSRWGNFTDDLSAVKRSRNIVVANSRRGRDASTGANKTYGRQKNSGYFLDMATPKHPTAADFRAAAALLTMFAREAAEIAAVMDAAEIERLDEGNIGSSVVTTLQEKLSGWLMSARGALIKKQAAHARATSTVAIAAVHSIPTAAKKR